MLVAVVILLWVFGKGCESAREAAENDKLKTYTNSVNDLSGRSAALGARFSQLANSVKSYPMSELDRLLSQVQTDCKALAEEGAKLTAPSKAADLQAIARAAFVMRTEGVKEYQVAILSLLNGGNRDSATAGVSKGLEDLLVSDDMLQRYRGEMQVALKGADINEEVIDPGKFVASIDCCSSGSINAYLAAIVRPPPQAVKSATPVAAIKAYLKSQGMDFSAMSFDVVSESGIDPSWKLDVGTQPGKPATYFLLHGSNGTWTVVKSGTTMTAAELKAGGAPSDIKAPGQSG